MLYLNYPTKKQLRTQVGERLDFEETSVFGPEYVSTGKLIGTNRERTYFAKVTLKDDVIIKVQ